MDDIMKQLQDTGYSDFDTTVREELKQQMREYLINWSKEYNYSYQMAVYSAVNGRYDDIEKDLTRNKYTLDEAILIYDLMLKYKLINQVVYNYRVERLKSL